MDICSSRRELYLSGIAFFPPVSNWSFSNAGECIRVRPRTQIRQERRRVYFEWYGARKKKIIRWLSEPEPISYTFPMLRFLLLRGVCTHTHIYIYMVNKTIGYGFISDLEGFRGPQTPFFKGGGHRGYIYIETGTTRTLSYPRKKFIARSTLIGREIIGHSLSLLRAVKDATTNSRYIQINKIFDPILYFSWKLYLFLLLKIRKRR